MEHINNIISDAILVASQEDDENIAKKVLPQEEEVEIEENPDYEKDGFLYCGKCHTPKETQISNKVGIFKVPVMCDCRKEEVERQKAETLASQNRLGNALTMGYSNEQEKLCTFENDDGINRESMEVAKRYVDNFDEMYKARKGLLLYGGVGTGKTYMAKAICNELRSRGYRCESMKVQDIEQRITDHPKGLKGVLESIKYFYKLVFIDDLGAERSTEYMNEMVYKFINALYEAQIPVIVTTNLTADELKHPTDVYQERVYSRLFEMCIPYEVKGKDRRKLKLRDSNKQLKELLGIGGAYAD